MTIMGLLKRGIYLITVIVFLLTARPVFAAILEVTNANDSGTGSFREAISIANSNGQADTIIFTPALEGETLWLATELPKPESDLTIDGTYAPLIDGTNVVGPYHGGQDHSCLYIDEQNNITISGLRITGFRFGITMYDAVSNITIEGCTITIVHADGEHASSILHYARFGLTSQNIEIINNTVENGPIGFHLLGLADGTTVQGATISGNTCNNASIDINLANTQNYSTTVENVMISNNVLNGDGIQVLANHHGGQVTSNCTINDIFIKGNVVEGDSIKADIASGTNNLISGLLIKDNQITRDDGEGIRLANDADRASNSIDTIIENNIVVNCGAEGIQIQGGIDANIGNNFVAGNRQGMAFYNGPAILAVNNLITKNITGIRIHIGSDESSTENIQLVNNMIVENCVMGIGPDSPLDPRSILSTLAYNNVWGNGTDYSNVSPGTSDISVDPLFVNASSGDYHLSDNSPCIDAGYPDLQFGDNWAGKGGPRADIGLYGGPGGVELVFPTPAVEHQAGIFYAELIISRFSTEIADYWNGDYALHLMVGSSPCNVDWVKVISPYDEEFDLFNDGLNGDFWANDQQFEKTFILPNHPAIGNWRFQVMPKEGQLFEETVYVSTNILSVPELVTPPPNQMVSLDNPVGLGWLPVSGVDKYRVLVYEGQPDTFGLEKLAFFTEVDSQTYFAEIPVGVLKPGRDDYFWIVVPVYEQDAGVVDYVMESMAGRFLRTQPFVIAAFDAIPTSGGDPLTVNFIDKSLGPVETWSWNFGDGSPLITEQNPSHTFTSEGQYLVRLTVSTTQGGGDTDFIEQTIDVHAMVAEIANPPDSLTKETEYTFFVGGEDVVTYRYKLDDGEWSNEFFANAPINLSIDTDGAHTLQVIGGDQAGTWQSMSSPTELNWIIDKSGPTISITTPNDGFEGDTITAIETSAVDDNGVTNVDFQVTDGIWYFNDSGSQTLTETWIAGSSGGGSLWGLDASGVPWTTGKNYTITARATDNAGNAATDAILVTIHDTTNNPAWTNLSFNLSSQSIEAGETINAAGQLTSLPVGGGSVATQTIRIVVKDANQNPIDQTTTTTDNDGLYTFPNLNFFSQPGIYHLNTSFGGTTSLYPSESNAKLLLVGDHPGYAILVQGRLPSDTEGVDAHNKTLKRIYDRLLQRGLADEDIYNFNYSFIAPNNPTGVDAAPDKGQVRWAVESWVANKMNTLAAPLYLIFIDHGNRNAFYIDDQVTISPNELHSWLNTLESRLDADAAEQKRCVIIGACYSGGFIPVISKPGRVVATSAATDEESFKGSMEPDGIRTGEFFMEEFFHDLWLGRSFKVAFQNAVARTEIYTRQGEGPNNSPNLYFDSAIQHPLLDDNGDQIGSNVLSVGFGDGQVAKDIYLGVGDSQHNGPVDVTGVTETILLDHLTSSTTLWAEANSSGATWIEVRPPSQLLDNEGGTGQLITPSERYDMTYNISRYENASVAFDQSGKYEVFYFHYEGDASANQISSMQRSLVYKDQDGNSSPDPFSLIAPTDTSIQKTMLLFDWDDAVDPDPGNQVTYNLIVAEDMNFETIAFQREEIPVSATFIDLSAGLNDASTYYWKVEAVDQYGALTPSSEVWSFVTNNTNAFPGWVNGTVYNKLTNEPLVGARVNASLGGAYADTAENGYYLMIVPTGIASVTASMAGFNDQGITGVKIPEGGVLELNIGLLPAGATADTLAPISSASLPEGTYDQGQTVELTCVDPGGAGCSAIYYTTDGTEPTSGADIYTEPIMICGDTTLKFYAKDAAGNDEAVHALAYNVTAGEVSVDGDCLIELSDAVLALQLLSIIDPAVIVSIQADVNNNNSIDLAEVIYILQILSGLRD